MVRKWIPKNLKRGALRRSLHIKKGQKIPAARLRKAAHARGKLGQRARFAQRARTFRHPSRRRR